MTCDQAKLVLADYWNQSLGEAQELAFEAHLATCDACRSEAERLGSLWKSLALIPSESKDFEPGVNLRSRFYETLGAYRQGLESAPKRGWRERVFALWPRQPAWQMGLSFALLVIGLGVGYQMHPAKGAGVQEQPAADQEVAQLRGEVNSMRQMVALSLMQQQSAGERLRGVSYAYQAPSSDTEVLSALLTTVNRGSERQCAAGRGGRSAPLRVEPGDAHGDCAVDSQAGYAAGADRAARFAGGPEGCLGCAGTRQDPQR